VAGTSGALVVLGLRMAEKSGMEFFAARLVYPPIGYGIETLCAADRMFRSG
jgi:hypothetical protein